MTDARFPERWLNDRRILRLSDSAHRLFVTALVWSVSNRTDGLLDRDDLRLLHNADDGATEELVKSELWEPVKDCWRIREFEDTQTTAAELDVLDNMRRGERAKKRRQRAHKAGDHSLCTPQTCSVPGTVTGTVPRTGEDRTGQARPGQAPTGAAIQQGCSWCNGAGCPNCSGVVTR